MTLSISLRTAARNLINTFGNSATIYTYSDAVKTTNEEGDVTISDWTHIQYVQSFTATAGQTDFTVTNIPITSVEEVTINGTATTAYTKVLATGVITLNVGATLNDVVIITYKIDNPATSIIVVDGNNAKEILTLASQGYESLGEDEKIVRDDVTLVINDRLNIDSVDYKIVEIRPTRAQSTLVIQIIRVTRWDSTTNW